MADTRLKVEGLGIAFGGLKAVSEFDIELKDGELVGLIGPNGAGKTTVFNMLSGLYQPTEGSIRFWDGAGREHEAHALPPDKLSKLGIARTFQNIRLFKELSVLDNVRVAMHQNIGHSVAGAFFRSAAYSRDEEELERRARRLLSIFGIERKAEEQAQNLPYGEQRKLEIVRALATDPLLLLLDEPAAGMNPQETKALMELIKFVRDEFKLTILLIEHDMNLVMGICERLVVIDYGKIIAKGLPAEIKRNPLVIKAYLGEEAPIDA
jgi:branched-chain amino acid transport system ATP-binding protein